MRRRRWRRLAAAHGGERRRGRRRQSKTASRARIRARVGLGARARDGELSCGSWEAVWRPCIGARRREAAWVVGARSDELSACERRGKQREKGAGVILTTVRSSVGALGRWEGDGAGDQRRRLRAPELQWRRRLGFPAGRGRRLRVRGVWGRGRCPFIGVRGESLACAPRRPRRGETRSDSGSARVPVGREEEDSPDRQGPPVGESGREGGEADWTWRGEWADGAPWAAGGRKKKEKRDGGVGRMDWKPRK